MQKLKKVEALTKTQQEKVEDFAQQDKLGHVIFFLLRTGLRIGEMLDLKWEDFDGRNNSVKIRKSKTTAGIREVPLSRSARLIIEYAKQGNKSEYIFLNTRNNKLTYSSVKKLFLRIKKETGIITFTPHVCRHTFATRMVENSVNYKALSSLLGHKNIAFTLQRYVTANMDFLKQQISLIEV